MNKHLDLMDICVFFEDLGVLMNEMMLIVYFIIIVSKVSAIRLTIMIMGNDYANTCLFYQDI